MRDFNWLLSTIVQSTAAIVAIISGFIINRLLTISAGRNETKRRISDIQIKKTTINNRIGDLKKNIQDWEIFTIFFNQDITTRIIEIGDEFDLNDAIRLSNKHIISSEEEMDFRWKNALNIIDQAKKEVEKLVEHIPSNFDNINNYLKGQGSVFSPLENYLYRRVFLKNKTRLLSNWEKNPKYIGAFDLSPRIEQDYVNVYPQKYDNDCETLVKNTLEKIELLSEEKELEQRLEQKIHIKDIWVGIVVLAFFSLVGIIIPLYFIPQPNEQNKTSFENLFFTLFTLGLLSFFGYLVYMIRQLIRD